MKTKLLARGNYDLRAVVFSHGWSDLAPFYVEDSRGALRVALRDNGEALGVRITGAKGGLSVESSRRLNPNIVASLRWMFRLDDDVTEFYSRAKKRQRSWISRMNLGRILRSQTLFEDLIKLILTTNCSWSFTRVMTDRLAQKLGEKTADGVSLFPTAEALAKKNETYFRDVIRAGYRAPSLVKLSRDVSKGKIDFSAWLDPGRSADDIRKEILKLPGAGPYVAENLLRFIGRHDRLALDSWARGKLQKMWKMKKLPADKTIERRYKPFGEYRGLILWCDLTRDWFATGEFDDWIRTDR